MNRQDAKDAKKDAKIEPDQRLDELAYIVPMLRDGIQRVVLS
jgi:hypothetical protein